MSDVIPTSITYIKTNAQTNTPYRCIKWPRELLSGLDAPDGRLAIDKSTIGSEKRLTRSP